MSIEYDICELDMSLTILTKKKPKKLKYFFLKLEISGLCSSKWILQLARNSL